MPKRALILLPARDFDPTESAVTWKILKSGGVEVSFATPQAVQGRCDERMLTGKGLGPWGWLLAANRFGRSAYGEMAASSEFWSPEAWEKVRPSAYDGLILPGGHAKGMREYLESPVLHAHVNAFFDSNKPVGAICHGVVLASRCKAADGHSRLFGRKTTALLASQEISAWLLTCAWLGDYYRTYPQTVEAEVRSGLARGEDFIRGPLPGFRDNPDQLSRGFVVRDGNYLSARWPGDAHRFGTEFLGMLGAG